jgi:lipopolysaccharide biosynthesis glycosyltransferase
MLMKDDFIHVGCGLNDFYLMPYGVLLVSLFETNKMNKFHIHVFSSELSETSIKTLKGITDKYNANFTYYPMDSALLANLAESDRISNVTYSWNVMPELVNPDVNKLLYLDGDMIVLDNIKPLWETDLNGYIIAAVDDIAAIKFKEFDRLKIPEEFGYFNTGTILINRKEWVKNDLSRKVLSYARENAEILKFLDQDAGNYVLHNKRKILHPMWNQQVGVYFLKKNFVNSKYSNEVLKEAIAKPVIVHFNGMEKPWEYANLHPFKDKFNYYWKLSGIEKPKEKKPLRKVAKKLVYRLFGWGRWNRI